MYSDVIQNEPRRTFLGMPGYGMQTAEAGRGFWRACADMRNVICEYRCGSLLASNFNQVWCSALNMVHEGRRIDYFAMLHDDIGPLDIGPDAFWLDMLIEELEAKQLDVLGAVVPIKDTRGMTSLALHQDGNDWIPFARLSMHDVFELPETFTSDDVGKPLLLNTGCWVCKFGEEWNRKVHFEINDRIVFNNSSKRFQAQTESEDWNFSRQLHEIGSGPTSNLRPLRIGATRKVKLMHRGDVAFLNTHAWGSNPFDAESSTHSPVPGAFPREIEGWLTPLEGKTLAELAAGKRVLEIGSYCGLSTVCMARTAKHVTAVDYFDGRGTAEPKDTLPAFRDNIERYGLTNIETCHPEAVYPLDEYDLAFIDGAHDAESVRVDVIRACEALAPDGLLVFHDYRRPIDPGVTLAVDEFIERGAQLLSTHESLAVVKPPAAFLLEV